MPQQVVYATDSGKTFDPVLSLRMRNDRARQYAFRTRKVRLGERIAAWFAGRSDGKKGRIATAASDAGTLATSRWLEAQRGKRALQVTEEWKACTRDVDEVWGKVRPLLAAAASVQVNPDDPDGHDAAVARAGHRQEMRLAQAEELGLGELRTRVQLTQQRELQLASEYDELAGIYLRAGSCEAPSVQLVEKDGGSPAQRSFFQAHPYLEW